MRLLICTQKVDRPDSTLGFFHNWIEELSRHVESIEVICLEEGVHNLPANVRVHSLGKETGRKPRLVYILRFYRLIISLRGRYDTVFVHMNQEYVLLGGPFWKLWGKHVYMWYNHYYGTFLTDFAAWWCNKVFCTSKFSHTAKYKKTRLMPVGIDIESSRMDVAVPRTPHSVLFLARLDPSKRPELFLDALGILEKRGINFSATVAGGPADPLSSYPAELKARAEKLGIVARVAFVGAVSNTETFRQYRSHDIFVNCSKSGMFDKTIFKAVACGCLVLTASLDFAQMVPEIFSYEYNNDKELADKLEHLLSVSPQDRVRLSAELSGVLKKNSLDALVEKLIQEIS